MKLIYKHLQLFAIGVYLLIDATAFAANACYSDAEFKNFKTLYIQLQNQLNYEGQDAYLDKNMQVQLRPHAKNTPYPGKEFENALFGEYQNSLRKIGKLYQDAKFAGNENFKSNELLVNFMKSIDDKSSDSQDYINKTKIKDVINALADASKKRYANTVDKRYVLTKGDQYLLEKLLTHAQDRLCSVNKYQKTNKGTDLFDADYLHKVKNAPLNVLIHTIKNAPINSSSKIELKPASDLTADLVDSDIAVKSAITENMNQLSAWVKKVKSRGAACMAAIRTKSFANKIQGQVQGCNFGHFMDTLGEENVSNLESILHFINANERLLDRAVAKAETNLEEMKLEGYISKTFDDLGSGLSCSIIDSANDGNKKIFIRNLPYNETTNIFNTSGIVCKNNSKILSFDTCKNQYELISDGLGRGIELVPKTTTYADLIISISDPKDDGDSNSSLTRDNSKDNGSGNGSGNGSENGNGNGSGNGSENGNGNRSGNSGTQLKDKSNINNKDILADLSGDNSKNNGNSNSGSSSNSSENYGNSNSDDNSKSDVNKETVNTCSDIVIKNLKPSKSKGNSDGKDKQDCEAKAKDGYKWNKSTKTCENSPILTASDNEKQKKLACENKSTLDTTFKWNPADQSCTEIKKDTVISPKKLDGNSDLNGSENKSQLKPIKDIIIGDNTPLKSEQEKCEEQKRAGFTYRWIAVTLKCEEKSIEDACATDEKERLEYRTAGMPIECALTKETCESQKKEGFVFIWDADKKVCNESSSNKNDDKKAKNKDDDNSEDGRKDCEVTNANWVTDFNDGTPSEKYRWDGKKCKDMKPSKDGNKKEKTEDIEELEAPSAPKRAPARFTPINIPSRQIYLMPGMP